ncbi:hypothetical protein KB575_00495 [Streptococcus canis]|uniref:hypothetical protein n=1 Tax=Streptococcus canis TaxID=1329 RepID=UPI00294A2F46|nr:hypothetical protein [Streptococcus canis]MDV5987547.1 hypothetical protein [Streptococcus canis]
MKKIFGLISLLVMSLILVACSSSQNLDGEYYWVSERSLDLKFEIKGDKGYYKEDSTKYPMKIDVETSTLTHEGIYGSYKFEYSSDGKMNVDGQDYYKKGSKAYKEALKKYNKKEKD